MDWASRDAEGNSGGLISLWKTDNFQKISSWHTAGALVVNGIWVEDGSRCSVINVYGPAPMGEKRFYGIFWAR